MNRSAKTRRNDMSTPVGGYILAAAPVQINVGRPQVKLTVRNTGDRPVQVGSHFHFFEVNRALGFDRELTFGHRLDIAAGTAVRFEPGDEREVTLVPFGGKRRIHGFNNLVDGWAPIDGSYRPQASRAIRRAEEYGFKSGPAMEHGSESKEAQKR
jgi:urease subunit beta